MADRIQESSVSKVETKASGDGGLMGDSMSPPPSEADLLKIKKIKQMNRVVCICKGIKLAAVMRGLDGSLTVDQVNSKVGTGRGGCAGERCGPRIQLLLKKNSERKK